ncbi:hypothetical protein KKG29_05130 [Patescibacteria group bacterium]|nr:DUF1016 domain-containing protein [Desulfobacteraceae bacterium]MBU3980849.1 hypothetical protein [Pseudomonadota bacterium]MBU4000518.1 hypothetical protein [Patescibacteria group bacterium]MBU4068624.1 hypothetical protein [Pseudomonadota bacterium]MBU4100706.1 hypothetical protein [Pseudomonadota bacterium]
MRGSGYWSLCRNSRRLWYAQKTIENGWSRDVLSFQIETQRHKRLGNAANNFELALPPADSA